MADLPMHNSDAGKPWQSLRPVLAGRGQHVHTTEYLRAPLHRAYRNWWLVFNA